MKNEDTQLEGFLLIDKPKGKTSYDVIRFLKRVLPKGTKIGHGGTLDPLATGLLIIGIGRGATKRFSEFLHADKIYVVTAKLGVETDTYDSEGTIISTKDASGIPKKALEDTLNNFLGEQEQIPPMYSAIKKDGKKLYELARKGEEVEREPRNIIVRSIELDSFSNPIFSFTVSVSGGTYIRTLVHDIGQTLGVGAVMTDLRRVAVSDFKIEQAVSLGSCKDLATIEKFL